MVKIPNLQNAWKFHYETNSLDREEIPVPTAGPDEVLLKVEAAGVCHSDLHILDASIPYKESFVLGHEIAGTIVSIGTEVNEEEYPVGQLVTVHGVNPCGACAKCQKGDDHQCSDTKRKHIGLGHDGGYEEYVALPARNTVAVPPGISAEIAAVTTDAVLTPYHALKRGGVTKGTKVLIIGLGGLGLNAVQVAKAFGAYVIATDTREEARQLGKQFGADEVLESLPKDPLLVEVVADFVGSKETFASSQQHVDYKGTIIPVGLHSPVLNLDLNLACFKETSILASFWGSHQEQKESLDLVAKGLVKPEVQVGDFEKLPELLDLLRRGEIRSRVVVKP